MTNTQEPRRKLTPEEFTEMIAEWERDRERRSKAWTPERRQAQSERLKDPEVQHRMARGRLLRLEGFLYGAIVNEVFTVETAEAFAADRQDHLSMVHDLREALLAKLNDPNIDREVINRRIAMIDETIFALAAARLKTDAALAALREKEST